MTREFVSEQLAGVQVALLELAVMGKDGVVLARRMVPVKGNGAATLVVLNNQERGEAHAVSLAIVGDVGDDDGDGAGSSTVSP